MSVVDEKTNDPAISNMFIRKLKSVSLKFSDLDSDVAFANLKKPSSQGGFIIFLINNNNKYAPIPWKSRKFSVL